jgi:CelD/BcsL family acetyltransferase involved in cellulose biosynthesis
LQTFSTAVRADDTFLAADSFHAAGAPETGLRESAKAFTVSIGTTPEAIAALEPEWRALELLSGGKSIFQSHAHIAAWAQHYATGRNAVELRIIVVREGGRAVLILPLACGRSPLVKVAGLAGDPIGQYGDVLADSMADGAGAFAVALDAARDAGIDLISLRRVRDDSALLEIGASRLSAVGGRSAGPTGDLTAFADYPSYLKSRSKNMRKGLRNRHHHLEKAGEVAFHLFEGGPEARDALADAFNLKRKWLIQRGAVSTAFLDARMVSCLLDMAGRQGAVATLLTVNGSPAAIRFGFEYGNTYFAYLSAYEPEHANLAPGKMLMDFYLSKFRERGIGRVDMLPPRDRHKTDWCDAEVGVEDHVIALSQRGRFYGDVYQKRIRPYLGRSWRRLPDAVRSCLTAILIHV